jgi:MFS family permease
MESFCMFLSGNFVALPYFKERYGVEIGLNAAGVMEYAIPTKWQSSLFQAGQCGAFVGVLLAGPVTNRLGYRWTTLLALFMMNATIFITFFVSILALETTNYMLTTSRPTLSRFSSLDRHSKVFHGASSSQTALPTPVRLSHWR